MASLSEVKASQKQLEASQKQLEDTVSDALHRLAALEAKASDSTALLDGADVKHFVTKAVLDESYLLRTRLDEFEDQSRRDNLIFYGVDDAADETWAESERKIRRRLLSSFSLELTDEGIARAHRLGAFVQKKCRPIVVKFASFKVKDSIWAQRTKLKNSGVSMQEDFCRATRLSRKKLMDYGKASGHKYNLRYNRLYVNKKCYVYSADTDAVCEVEAPSGNASENDATAPPASPPLASESRDGSSFIVTWKPVEGPLDYYMVEAPESSDENGGKTRTHLGVSCAEGTIIYPYQTRIT
ncbi:uncharacterized protein LOC144103419 [Amblyomma americanum]